MPTAEFELLSDRLDTETSVTNRRFSGLARLYGNLGAARIQAAHVVVVGLGGVGSWAAEAAARSGVARLTLVDLDHIAESNINRQVHALHGTLGQSKVQAMRERILQINANCNVVCVEEFVDAENWPDVVSCDLLGNRERVAIIDACDQVKAKTAMAAWAIEEKMHFISVGAAGGKRHAHMVNIDDLSQVTHDPLLAQLRYRLRKLHAGARSGPIKIACVFSRESVVRPAVAALAETANIKITAEPLLQSDSSLNCHGYGSVVSVTATFGMCAASWVLNKIAG